MTDLKFGIFTTDTQLIVCTWDPWMAAATGIEPARALGRPLTDVLPEIASRGFVSVLRGVLSRGTVEVLSPALHHFLFGCAPSAPSTFDRMQQHVTIGPLREEGRIVGVIVTIEDVTFRIERERQAVAAPDYEGDIDSLTRLLGNEDWGVRRRAVASLSQRGAAVVDSMIRTLRQQHDNLSVLSSALDLLAISDIDVIEPLARFLEDEDPNLRTQAALILGERRDRRAIAPLIAHLSDPDVNVAFHVIEALGRLQAVEACEPLVEIAERRDFFLSFPAIQALVRVATPAVAPRLVPLLTDDLLRAPTIEALGELGDEDVTLPLVELLNTAAAPTEVITDALAGLYDRYESHYGAGEHIAALVRRSVSAAGTQSILDAVQRVGADRLAGLAKVLGWLEGEAVQRALTRLLGFGAVRAQVVEALVRNGGGVSALLTEQLRAEDLETRQAAAVALGRIGGRSATGALVDALSDRDLAVAAAGALARIGDADAFPALIRLLGEPDAAIRQAVIAALNSIGHPEMPYRVAALLDDADPTTRESALKIAGYFGYPTCLPLVLVRCRDSIDAVRRTAVEQLPFFDDPQVVDALLAALQDERAPVRAAAAHALGRIDHPSRADALVGALSDADSWVRYVAVKSLAAVGVSSALPAVVDRLRQDPAPHVRLAAVEVVGRLAPPNALAILEPLIGSGNEDIARAAICALGHLHQPEALALLERESRAPAPWRRLAAIDAITLRRDDELSRTLEWIAAADGDVAVVSAAVSALRTLGQRDDRQGSEATGALIALTREPALRQAVIAALSSLPPRRTRDIAAGLNHVSPAVRCAIAEALGRMKQPDASRALEGALDDDEPSVRLTAVAELKHLGTRTSLRKLMQVARTDPHADVRRAAMMAVSRIEPSAPPGARDPG